MRNRLIPIAIVISQHHGGNVNYTAFSPREYDVGSETRKRMYEKFMKKLYEHISYDPNNLLNNNSSLGKVLEIHTRFIRVPLDQRRVLVNFSAYDHPSCNYMPIHHASPLKFGALTEEEYNTQHQHRRILASHDFV